MSIGRKTEEFDQVRERRGGRSSRVREAVLKAVRSELESKGYSSLSHRNIAAVAGVDHVTVYRRWPTRARLVADLFRNLADTLVPVPDTGEIRQDLEIYLASIVQLLSDPGLKQLLQAFFAASIEGDEAVGEALSEIWLERFSKAYTMLDRAVLRGELPPDIRYRQTIENLVAPVWFRTFVSRMPASDQTVKGAVADLLRVIGKQKDTLPPSCPDRP